MYKVAAGGRAYHSNNMVGVSVFHVKGNKQAKANTRDYDRVIIDCVKQLRKMKSVVYCDTKEKLLEIKMTSPFDLVSKKIPNFGYEIRRKRKGE